MGFLSKFFNRQTKPDSVPEAPYGFSFLGGILVTEDTAMKASAWYRGVIYLSGQLAKLPINVKAKDNSIIDNHRISFLLNVRPNPEVNANNFKRTLFQDAINRGNAYAEIERDGAFRPIALWYLDARRVQPFRNEFGQLRYRVSGGGTYANGGSSSSGYDTILTPNDIFHLPNIHILDGIVGQSPVEWASRTLGITIGADRLAGSLFNNNGLPSGILKTPNRLSEEAYQRVKKSWKEQHSGEKSGGVAILEEGLAFEAINMDPQMLQMLESRKFGVLEMARYLGLHPNKLYDVSNSTYNNMENANLETITDSLDIWATNFESEADCKLLNDCYGGNYLSFDFRYLSRGDMKTRGQFYKDMQGVGAFSPNEIRNLEGEAPYAGGDDRYISSNNMTPTDMVRESVEAQIKKNSTPAAPAKEEDPIAKAILDTLTRGK